MPDIQSQSLSRTGRLRNHIHTECNRIAEYGCYLRTVECQAGDELRFDQEPTASASCRWYADRREQNSYTWNAAEKPANSVWKKYSQKSTENKNRRRDEVSNVLGCRSDKRTYCICHRQGAVVVVDVHSRSAHEVDIRDLDADFLAFSGQ